MKNFILFTVFGILIGLCFATFMPGSTIQTLKAENAMLKEVHAAVPNYAELVSETPIHTGDQSLLIFSDTRVSSRSIYILRVDNKPVAIAVIN